MRRSLLVAGFLALLLCFGGTVHTEEEVDQALAESTPSPEALRDQADIVAPSDAPVGRPILLDASLSRIVGVDVRFTWYVSGVSEPISKTVDAVYTPDRPGTVRFRLIVQSTVDGNPQESQVVQEVTVYRRKMVIVADPTVDPAKVNAQVQAATGSNLYVKVLRAPVPSSSDAFPRYLLGQSSAFHGAEAIVLWMDPVAALQSLVSVFPSDATRMAELKGQTVVLVTGRRLETVAQTARAPFSVLQPKQILLLHPDALGSLFLAPDVPSFLSAARARDIAVATVDASTAPVPPWQVLSLLVDFLLIHGISSQTVLLLLMLPVIATILSFLKQVVGLVTFGLFTPSIVALSFLSLGWRAGLLFFLFIMIAAYVSRALVYRLRILYIPKLAIIITIVSLLLLVLLSLNLLFGVVLSRDTVFVLLIMATLAESFLTAKSGQGWAPAFSGIGQTLVAALLCVVITQWGAFQTLVLAYPEIILFTIVVNFMIGRYTGLRLSEYYRFRAVFRHVAGEE
jgi:hypothetical protein